MQDEHSWCTGLAENGSGPHPGKKISLTEPNTLLLHRYNSVQCHSPPFYYITRTKQDCSPTPNHATHFYPPTKPESVHQGIPCPCSFSGPPPVISVTTDKYCPHLLCSGFSPDITKHHSSCAQNYHQPQPCSRSKVDADQKIEAEISTDWG